jgi:hypothetical protein
MKSISISFRRTNGSKLTLQVDKNSLSQGADTQVLSTKVRCGSLEAEMTIITNLMIFGNSIFRQANGRKLSQLMGNIPKLEVDTHVTRLRGNT